MEKHHGDDPARPTAEVFILWDPISYKKPCWMFATLPSYNKLSGDAYPKVALAFGYCPFGGSAADPKNADWLECAPIDMKMHVPANAKLTSPHFTVVDGIKLEQNLVPLFVSSKRTMLAKGHRARKGMP